jgi:hypothetical protein
MRLHLWRPTADHLFTEEGEPQPVSSCRADGRGSRSLARRLFFLRFFGLPGPAREAIRPHLPQNPQALDFSSAVADTRASGAPTPSTTLPPEEAQAKKQGPQSRLRALFLERTAISEGRPAYAEGVGEISEPIAVTRFRWRHRWPGGLYIVAMELYEDRLAVRVFTSRPIATAELLDRLHPFDMARTAFIALPPTAEVIDGNGVLEYKPAPPEGLSRLGLDDKLGHRLSPYWKPDVLEG